MLPVLFRIGSLEIPSFGVALATGVALAWFYFLNQFPEKDRNAFMNLVTLAVVTGLIGARVNYILEHLDEILSARDLALMLISRSGLTVYGGFIAGTLAAYVYSRKKALPALKILDAGAGAICIGYFFGRLGCQLAGDGDYGTPSNLPWAMSYPNGTVPTLNRVHPTPVYEMIFIAMIFALLVRLKRRSLPAGQTFFIFMILAGMERFAIEFIRLNRPLIFSLTEPQIVSICVIAAGSILLLHNRRVSTFTQEERK